MIWLLLAWVIDRAQLKIGAPTYGGKYCGFGAVPSVLQRQADAPMAYRVLVPWLMAWAPSNVQVYEALKIGLMALALWATAHVFGAPAAVILAVLWCSTFLYDYWDTYAEIAGLMLALSGNLPLAITGAVLLGLSRETAPLTAVVYGLVTHDWPGMVGVGAVSLAALGVARLWAGRHELYCDRWMVRLNLDDVRHLMRNRPFYLGEITMSVLVTALTGVVMASGNAGPAWPVPLVLLGAGWTMARAAETRVFAGALPWLAAALTRML